MVGSSGVMIEPPELTESSTEFGVVQVRVLMGQVTSRRLRPDHERVHWSLHSLLP